MIRLLQFIHLPVLLDYFVYMSNQHYDLRSFGPIFEAIQDVIASTSWARSLDVYARRIFESIPSVPPTSLATDSHGVPTAIFAKNSLPRFTASAIAGGTSGRD